MKALILAAGYATRLYPLTKDRPKPLLPVGNVPMIEHVLSKLNELNRDCNRLDRIFIVTNHRFAGHFAQWTKLYKGQVPVKVMDDGTASDADKLGAVGDMRFVIEKGKLRDDLLVVAGDNLFDFDLNPFALFAAGRKPMATIGLYDFGDRERVKKYGVVTLDSDNRVIDFKEKPRDPATSLISICLYFFPAETLHMVKKFMDGGNNTDAPGYYIQWLHKNDTVFGHAFSGKWLDIGDRVSYEEAQSFQERR